MGSDSARAFVLGLIVRNAINNELLNLKCSRRRIVYSNEKYQDRIFTDNFNKKKYQLTNNIELLKIIVEQRISWPLETGYSSEEDRVRGAVKRQIQKQLARKDIDKKAGLEKQFELIKINCRRRSSRVRKISATCGLNCLERSSKNT